MPKKRDN